VLFFHVEVGSVCVEVPRNPMKIGLYHGRQVVKLSMTLLAEYANLSGCAFGTLLQLFRDILYRFKLIIELTRNALKPFDGILS
jgi:hypothetical protein